MYFLWHCLKYKFVHLFCSNKSKKKIQQPTWHKVKVQRMFLSTFVIRHISIARGNRDNLIKRRIMTSLSYTSVSLAFCSHISLRLKCYNFVVHCYSWFSTTNEICIDNNYKKKIIIIIITNANSLCLWKCWNISARSLKLCKIHYDFWYS